MILALDNHETGCVLMGRGIGFSKSKGDFIDSEGVNDDNDSEIMK